MTRDSRTFRGGASSLAGASALGMLTLLSVGGFAGCLGGTGTDTENGIKPVLVTARVVTQDSAPAAGVAFTVYQAYNRADSLLESPLVGGDTTHLVTDGAGYVTFFVKKDGDYVAQGADGDTILFLDTLRTKINRGKGGTVAGGPGSRLFRVEEPVRATGRLRLLSGNIPDSGRVVLQGTRLLWKLETDGMYDLGWLPPSAEKLTLRVVYWSSSAPDPCVKPGTGGTNAATLSLEDGEIVVDDLVKGPDCPLDAPH